MCWAVGGPAARPVELGGAAPFLRQQLNSVGQVLEDRVEGGGSVGGVKFGIACLGVNQETG